MKMFYFEPNAYGDAYHILAEDRYHAIVYLAAYFLKQSKDESNEDWLRDKYYQLYVDWRNADESNPVTYPSLVGGIPYSILEYDVGEIHHTEIS